MTRGNFLLITDTANWMSIQFNGDMYPSCNGKFVYHMLESVETYDDLAAAILKFDEERLRSLWQWNLFLPVSLMNISKKREKRRIIMRAIDIKWDTDGDEEVLKTLPTEMDIPNGIDEDDVADWLSDETGFCVFGFVLEAEKNWLCSGNR